MNEYKKRKANNLSLFITVSKMFITHDLCKKQNSEKEKFRKAINFTSTKL